MVCWCSSNCAEFRVFFSLALGLDVSASAWSSSYLPDGGPLLPPRTKRSRNRFRYRVGDKGSWANRFILHSKYDLLLCKDLRDNVTFNFICVWMCVLVRLGASSAPTFWNICQNCLSPILFFFIYSNIISGSILEKLNFICCSTKQMQFCIYSENLLYLTLIGI